MNNYTYTYACRNIFNTIKTSGHSSLEKIYTSHFIDRVVRERELETEQRLQHIPTNSSGHHSLSLPFSWAAQPGAWGPSLCWDMVLIPASSLQLIRTSCAPSYIIVLRPLNSNRRQSRLSPDILDRIHLLFTQVHILFWQLGRIGGQYATLGFILFLKALARREMQIT